MLRINIVKGIENTSVAKDIRIAVFVAEQGFEDEFDDIDDLAWHIEIWDEDIPVAVGRMFESDKAGVYTVGRIAVINEYRRRHLGKTVMEALEDHGRKLGGIVIQLSAQCSAAGFYEKMGYAPHGEVYLDQFCPHIKMSKNL
jgi:predicted GNAT family N-acyltransferase